MSCGNSDILALIDYFQNGTDLSNNDWDNYNYYDLWNAIENGATPPNRTVCATFVQADIRSIVFAVLGVFTSPSDYLGENIDFYYLYLKAIGQEVVSPSFGNFCIGQLYNLFSIGLTAKFRQPQGFNVTMSKVAAIASITFEQGQQLDALLSKSAAIQNAVFEQQQTFNAELAAGFTGLLDDYPNAAAAYSVRLLSSTYTGALVRIRRSSDNTEKDFYPDSNNELSLSSEDGASISLSSWIASDNGFVTIWYDQSGGTVNNAIQASTSAQPQLINSGSLITNNSKPTLEYVSGTQELTLSLDFTTTHSVFTVNQFAVRSKEIIGATGRYLIFQSDTETFYRLTNTGFVQFGGVLSLNQMLLYVNKNSTDVSIYENSTQIGSTQSITGTSVVVDNLSGESSGYNFIGNMQEVVVYTSDESANKTGIESNINNFYSIY